ncbi:hypothetical protein D3C81_2248630 [compost metagenome]
MFFPWSFTVAPEYRNNFVYRNLGTGDCIPARYRIKRGNHPTRYGQLFQFSQMFGIIRQLVL